MIHLSSNIKYLRKQQNILQGDLADKLGVARTTLGDYERGKSEPSLSMLKKLSETFSIDIDSMINFDLSKDELEINKSSDMRILAISVDSDNNENIELVDTKAEAGYLDGFQDPEYIRELPKISLPNFPVGTYRGFEIQGDSMQPIQPGALIICSYIENLDYVKEGVSYIVVSRDRGLVYKRLYRDASDPSVLILSSDNPAYPPYTVPKSDIAEVWQYYAHLSFSDGKEMKEYIASDTLLDIQQKVTEMYERGVR